MNQDWRSEFPQGHAPGSVQALLGECLRFLESDYRASDGRDLTGTGLIARVQAAILQLERPVCIIAEGILSDADLEAMLRPGPIFIVSHKTDPVKPITFCDFPFAGEAPDEAACLAGTNRYGSTVSIRGEDLPLGDVVRVAQKNSGMSGWMWNLVSQESRDVWIDQAIDEMRYGKVGHGG